MKAEYINPFLESASHVIEQVINIRPIAGKLSVKNVKFLHHFIWIQIGISGQVNGGIVFGLHEQVAMKMISVMMGGFSITEIDEMGKSAISELGNMISGNASTLFYNQGMQVDITPPVILQPEEEANLKVKKALTVPLIMSGIGELEIQVLIA